jgi:DNA-binding transcriptional regulator YhcF (GntR family)
VSLRQTHAAKEPRTAVDIESFLESRIRSGLYPEGARIPTVREMAEQLGVNKNTVVRAYQALERKGYLELTRGRGAFVRQRVPATGTLDSRWLAQLDRLLDDARTRSLTRDALMQEITRSVDRFYGTPGLKIAFVECNAPDIEEMGGQIGAAVGQPLEGVMLNDFLAQPAELAARCDLIVTTFYHLGEASRALGAAAKEKLVGVHALPVHDATLNIARLNAQVIGLVCDRASTIDNLTHIIHTYHPAATIMPALIDEVPRLRMVLDKADAIVATRSCHPRLMAMHPPMPVIMVTFTIERQSIEFLQNRMKLLSAKSG